MGNSAIFEKAEKLYHEGLWKKSYLRALVKAGKLTVEEYQQITGEEFA